MADKKLGFAESFMLSGVAAGVSKTAAAPIERVKLLIQNQDEMIKQGRLDKPYSGVVDCTTRVLKTEGVYPFWRGKRTERNLCKTGLGSRSRSEPGVFVSLEPEPLEKKTRAGAAWKKSGAGAAKIGRLLSPARR